MLDCACACSHDVPACSAFRVVSELVSYTQNADNGTMWVGPLRVGCTGCLCKTGSPRYLAWDAGMLEFLICIWQIFLFHYMILFQTVLS